MKLHYQTSALAISLCALSFSANAAAITGVTAEYSSSSGNFNNLGASAANYNVNAIVDGTGLTGATHDNTFSSNSFLHDNNVTDGTIDIDLGAVYNVESLLVWNYNSHGTINRGFDSADVSVSADGITYSSAGSLSFAQANDPNTPGEAITFSSAGIQHVRLENITLHDGLATGGIGEIQFYSEPVPEPGSFALMGAVVGLLGVRRRR